MRIDDSRILVVGASSGIGRAIAEQALAGGAQVTASARRESLLAQIGVGGEDRATVIVGDVEDPSDCNRIVTDAVAAMKGLDALVYAAGTYRLVEIADATADDWQRSFAVNATGAALVTQAALPALRESRGRAVYLSSEVVNEPRAGLAPYGASKCALEHLIAGLRLEHPEISFTSALIGATGDTDIGVNTPREDLARYFDVWKAAGFRSGGLMTPAEVATEVLRVLRSEVEIFNVEVQPRHPTGD